MGCIPSPMYRVIHRSLVSDAIEQQKRSLLKEILEVLEEQRMKTPSPWPYKEKQKPDLAALSEIKTSLAALEEIHILHKQKLIDANEKINMNKQRDIKGSIGDLEKKINTVEKVC